jgi:hypothetical protein
VAVAGKAVAVVAISEALAQREGAKIEAGEGAAKRRIANGKSESFRFAGLPRWSKAAKT